MGKREFELSVLFNYAASTGAAIRNGLDGYNSEDDREHYKRQAVYRLGLTLKHAEDNGISLSAAVPVILDGIESQCGAWAQQACTDIRTQVQDNLKTKKGA